MNTEHLLLIFAFGIIALVYSSVGFGGGSSYLALLAVVAVSFELIRPIALICNILVVTGGTYIFYKQGKFNFKRNLPFVAASIPFAYFGGFYPIKEKSFFIILGVTLILASLLLWFQNKIQKLSESENEKPKSDHLVLNVGLGGGVGFLSGLVSIGGGIFLSPLLHLMNWDEVKKISAMASFFILVNSISGLAGQLTRGVQIDWQFTWPLLIAVLIGGQIGSRLGATVFNPFLIKRITAVLILMAGVNILIKHL